MTWLSSAIQGKVNTSGLASQVGIEHIPIMTDLRVALGQQQGRV